MSKKTFFQEGWLDELQFQPWLERDKDTTYFRCKFCRSRNSLSNMRALESHVDGRFVFTYH